jgi:hypothetical protein
MKTMSRYGSKQARLDVWRKCKKIKGLDPDMWRKDVIGNTIRFEPRPKRICKKKPNPEYSWNWDVDHIIPRSCGGDDWLDNLQALNRRSNIGFSNKLTNSKPGYNKRDHFTQILIKSGATDIFPRQKLRLRINTRVMVRTSPVGKRRLEAIIKAVSLANDSVTIYWVNSKYNDEIILDDRLFETI